MNRLTDIYRHLYQSQKTGPYQNPNIYPVTKVATLNIKMKKKICRYFDGYFKIYLNYFI